MPTEVSAAAVVDLCTAIIAVQILPFLAQQLGAVPSAQAPLLYSAVVALLLPLAALAVLATAVTVIYRSLHHASEGATGNRRLWRLFTVLCAAAGVLEFFFFVQPAGVVGDVGVKAVRALGLAAFRLLPAAAAATFFLGMALMLITSAHIRAGGEGGGGGAGAFAAADGQIQGPVSFLTKAALGAAAALVWLMGLAVCATLY